MKKNNKLLKTIEFELAELLGGVQRLQAQS
jgi:hypothetical protein